MNYYQEHHAEFLEGLKAFLRIPASARFRSTSRISGAPPSSPATNCAAAGLTRPELIEGEGNPLVYAEWLGAPGKPTILFYGHYDVQPPDPLDEWKSPPFEPEVRGDDIFARGACDDKGQVYIQIKAVEGLLKTTGRLPVNVKFLLEGEEETGGEHIEAYVKTRPPRLQADAAVVCDTEMFAPELPTICVGLRGMVYCELHVEGANHDLHSGVYGGAAPNPMQAIAEIIMRAQGSRRPHPDSRLLRPRRAAERQGARRHGRACRSTRRNTPKRRWARASWWASRACRCSSACGRGPTLEVHGIRGGFTGEGAKTVIPARAVAKISTRLVARPARGRSRSRSSGGGEGRLPERRHGGVEGAALRRAVADQSRQSLHPRRGRGHEADVRQGDGVHPLRRIDPDRRRLRPLPGDSQRDDGLRPAGRQSARAQ